MPVQTWTAGQVLTDTEMTSITNMLPYPSVATSSVNPCVAGTLYRCQPAGGTLTMTLPAPAAGSVVGFLYDDATGTVNVVRHASETIYSPVTIGSTRGTTSLSLLQPDAYIVLIGDGTNWHRVGDAELRTYSLDDTTLSSPAATYTSPTIPAGWSTIEIDLFGKTDQGAGPSLRLQFNGDTGNNYDWMLGQISDTGSVAAARGNGVAFIVPCNNMPPNTTRMSTAINVRIPNYTDASNDKPCLCDAGRVDAYSAGNLYAQKGYGWWHPASPAAITSLKFSLSAGNFGTGSRFVVRLMP